MQYKNSQFDPAKHDRFTALTVKQPYAFLLLEPKEIRKFGTYPDDEDFQIAHKSIEVRPKNTNFRGDILITSSINPVFKGLYCGATIGFVELYDVKKIKDFTEQDWIDTRIPKEERLKYKKGYGWLMRNPRKVIEYPVRGQVGIWNLVYTKGDIMEYPTSIIVDKLSYKK